MKTLVVIPTFNERATIEEVLRRTREAGGSPDVLVVDDGSPDATAGVAEKAAESLGGVTVMRRNRKAGLGDAYRAGFRWGLDRGYEALVEMDADLSHDPAVIPDLVGLLADHDLAIGSRYVPGGTVPKWGAHRRLISWAGNRYSSFTLGVHVHDLTSGFRAFRAEALQRIDLDSVRADGYGFQIEMAYLVSSGGGKIAETPICFTDRTEGESKMSTSIALEALILVTKLGISRLRHPGGDPSLPITSFSGTRR
ncbi:MAG TPA: polyprenol monophosphomannose synthase [Acidimicrobiales bacterium]|nr:polyprenol monophosphomannose synthase [Acidimicrobiales bacterium]